MSAALVWFRRDLRTYDHAALHQALRAHPRVHCVFVFDTTILDALPRRDRRVEFILRAVEEVDAALRAMGGALIVRHGDPLVEIPRLAAELGVSAVYANRDYEPAAIARDAEVKRRTASAVPGDTASHNFHDFKDQVIFDRSEVMTQGGTPFSVFTPYKNAWLKRLDPTALRSWPIEDYASHLAPPRDDAPLPTLRDLGFEATDLAALGVPTGMSGAQALFRDFIERIDDYAATRDFPAIGGTSGLSPHLRFGTISIRQLAAYAHAQAGRGASTWLSELIWRDFYHAILWHQPRVATQCFKPAFDALRWDDAPDLLDAWRAGRTGYPLVDAAMRQLVATGWMHNRLRMIVASFLTKDLGLDWRQGEAWFAEKLLDFDLAANNGGWQWAASTGCDAQPWFRIFNPVTQSEKFDTEGRFIRRYVPELARVPQKFIHAPWKMSAAEQAACGVRIGADYPAPVVDHAEARARTLARFQAIRE
ncbi:cryptochrome/photolyase family protein [Sulfuritalea hydrogenivorans]|uniref:Deoxyribodipyrimidine photo-lyase n=1 Tax=Sulfuritalea hydrogenivorans sk43H TaxID=1223802 RepID=W0SB06_9PROT|nr:deoxyribodipyrimidine photo-lyase [Sulfuritalea hydrogenivorans]BAO28072.1 deoxyribodipyrimidine photo-lyase [Sulfuritalea hydrogenivorans sk43H]